VTVLTEKYSEYGDTMCTHLQSILIKLPRDLNKFENSKNGKTAYEEQSVCCGRKSSFELEVLDINALVEKKWNALEDQQQEKKRIEARNCKIFNIFKSKQGAKEKLKHLKIIDPTLYTEDKMYFFINGMENAFPSNVTQEKMQFLRNAIDVIFPLNQNAELTAQNKRKFIEAIAKTFPVDKNEEEKVLFLRRTMEMIFPSVKHTDDLMAGLKMVLDSTFPLNENVDNRKSHWVLATSRLEIDGKMCALSQFLTYMHFDGIHDPVEKMKGRSPITIIHQDLFLIEGSLKNISQIFEKAVLWNSNNEDLSILIDEVGLIRYIFANSMCCINGSAAIGEWYQETLFNHHGYQALQTEGDKACDLEALTATSLGGFMNVYRRMTHLEKLPLPF
jgi:hypothetical protein